MIKTLQSLGLAITLIVTGCANYTFEDILLDIHDIAWLGTTAAVQEAPSSVDDLERAVVLLKVVEAENEPTIADIVKALEEAGVTEFKTDNGDIYITGGQILLARADRLIPVGDHAKVKQVAEALRSGIERGLGQ